jgi:hypothetical protein
MWLRGYVAVWRKNERKNAMKRTKTMYMLLTMLCLLCSTWAMGQTNNAELAKQIDEAVAKGNTQEALKLSMGLDASEVRDATWATNARTLANLLYQVKSEADKVEYIRAAFTEAATMEGEVATRRRDYIAAACYDYWKGDANAVRMVEMILENFGPTVHNISMLYNANFHLKEYGEALSILEKHAGVIPAEQEAAYRLNALAALKRTDDIPAAVLAYLAVSTSPVQAVAALQNVLPGDDAALCAGLTAQKMLDGYKIEVRRSTGRNVPAMMVTLANQLTKGGDDRPLRVSDEAKALADKLDSAPLAAYLQPLLRGDYKSAFKFAYTQAKSADTDPDYIVWINAAAGVIRCADQCYNGRALGFIRYVNGDDNTNPATELLETK